MGLWVMGKVTGDDAQEATVVAPAHKITKLSGVSKVHDGYFVKKEHHMINDQY